MGYSRIDKLVREMTMAPSLAQAAQARRTPVNLLVGSNTTGKAAVMALTAAGLSFRCFHGPVRVFLTQSEPEGVPWLPGSLKDQLYIEAKQYGAEDRLQFPSGNPTDGATLSLGTAASGAIVADAAGWVAGVGLTLRPEVSAVPPAAVLATSCAFAKLFGAIVLGDVRAASEVWTFSLQDFTPDPPIPVTFTLPDLNLGTVGLLGAGAVGSGFAFTLWLSNWTGHVDVIDRDHYEEPNLETTMLITRQAALRGDPKANALAAALNSRPGLTATAVATSINRNSPELLTPRDVFVCAVDNPEIRRELDSTNAGLLLNGAVGGSRLDSGHVLWSRHGPDDAPLATLYPERNLGSRDASASIPAPIEVQDECSRLAYGNVSMAAPFIALASGALLLAGCAHRALGMVPDVNYLKLDLFGFQRQLLRKQRLRE